VFAAVRLGMGCTVNYASSLTVQNSVIGNVIEMALSLSLPIYSSVVLLRSLLLFAAECVECELLSLSMSRALRLGLE